jgi:general L-amino acid transport system permease protein
MYVQRDRAPELRPPITTAGPIGWVRANLFSSPLNAVLTLLIVALLLWIVPPAIRFLLIDATWTGNDREACLATAARPEVGACWAFIKGRFFYFIYGSYPVPLRWRVDVFFGLLAFGIAWLLWLDAPLRRGKLVFCFIVLPVVSFILLHGWSYPNLTNIRPVTALSDWLYAQFRPVDTALWGGALVTLVVSAVGIATSLPLGIVLALGRRSRLPAIRVLSIAFIEFMRGVPLIAVLFMASVMLPLFLPPAWSPDKLLRALVGVALFSSAYMAEVVRAGLLAVPRGQYDAAAALGLSRWPSLRLVILPQALRVTIPNIVNSYIALFKDTTLVFFVGIFDFLRTIEVSRNDPNWATPVTSVTGYAFAAIVYFICCYGMSQYARGIERRLDTGRR